MAVVRALVLLVIASCRHAWSDIIGAAVLPHGDFAFDPELLTGVGSPESHAKAESLHTGAVAAAKFIAGLEPDVIVLTSPHGLQSSWDWSFYGNSHLQGRALVGRDTEESYGDGGFAKYTVKLDAVGAPQLASDLVDGLASKGNNVTLLKGWNDVIPQELHWGEVLPLELLRRAGNGHLPPVLVLGLPLSRYNQSSAIAVGVQHLGEQLGRLLASSNRVAFVVSTDLAHRHWANTTFGFSPDAAIFDSYMGKWGSTLDDDALMGARVLGMVDHIYSCGYLGMVLLQGVLAASGHAWEAVLTAESSAPTYYGMMSALFKQVQTQTIVTV